MTTLIRIEVSGLLYVGSNQKQNYVLCLVKRQKDYTVQCWKGREFKTCDYYIDRGEAQQGLRHYMKQAIKGAVFMHRCKICESLVIRKGPCDHCDNRTPFYCSDMDGTTNEWSTY